MKFGLPWQLGYKSGLPSPKNSRRLVHPKPGSCPKGTTFSNLSPEIRKMATQRHHLLVLLIMAVSGFHATCTGFPMSPVSFPRSCNSAMLAFPQQCKVTLVAPWQLIVHSCGAYRLWLFVHVPPKLLYFILGSRSSSACGLKRRKDHITYLLQSRFRFMSHVEDT